MILLRRSDYSEGLVVDTEQSGQYPYRTSTSGQS